MSPHKQAASECRASNWNPPQLTDYFARFSPTKPVKGAIKLGSRDILKVSLTIKEGSQVGRPHQAFLLVQEPESKVEIFFPLSVKELSGKARVDLV